MLESFSIPFQVLYILLPLTYIVFLIFACMHNLKQATPLLGLTAMVTIATIYSMLVKKFGAKIYAKLFQSVMKNIDEKWYIIRW